MATRSSGCYYGVHFGCLCAARDPNCRRCAERLTNAVNYVLHPGLNDELHTAAAPYATDVSEAHQEKTESAHFVEVNDVWRDPELQHE